MRRFLFSFVAAMAVACFAGTAYAQRDVVVDFRQFADPSSDYPQIGEDNAWGGRSGQFNINPFPSDFGQSHPSGQPGIQYTVDGVTFSYYGEGGTWAGVGLSSREDMGKMDSKEDMNTGFFHEMASVTGNASSGSVYGIIYGSSEILLNNDKEAPLSWDNPKLPVIMFGSGVELVSMDITNTAYTVGIWKHGDLYGTNPGRALDLIIYGVNAGGLVDSLTVGLTWEDGYLDDWKEVDLRPLTGSTELRFAWVGSEWDDLTWMLAFLDLYPEWEEWAGIHLSYPTYVAFDNIVYRTAIPEPGTLAILGLGLAGLGLARRRRKAEPQS